MIPDAKLLRFAGSHPPVYADPTPNDIYFMPVSKSGVTISIHHSSFTSSVPTNVLAGARGGAASSEMEVDRSRREGVAGS